MSGGALVVLFLLVGFGFTIGLYALIREETSNPRVVDRAEAEREAREVGGLGAGGRRTAQNEGDATTDDDDDQDAADGWGAESRWDR